MGNQWHGRGTLLCIRPRESENGGKKGNSFAAKARANTALVGTRRHEAALSDGMAWNLKLYHAERLGPLDQMDHEANGKQMDLIKWIMVP
ncbi:MAG TPA: hypothetical protein VFD98_05795 [Terracidiphilus sp.]|jgi:hypothetical protein|nr:hypothetical protein [Terracidiphilus sp.]